MTDTKILPCPFCGSTDAPIVAGHRRYFWVECALASEGCGMQTILHPTHAEAIAAWNRRTALQWPPGQPMATAPRDGSDILVSVRRSPGLFTVVDYWDSEEMWSDAFDNHFLDDDFDRWWPLPPGVTMSDPICDGAEELHGVCETCGTDLDALTKMMDRAVLLDELRRLAQELPPDSISAQRLEALACQIEKEDLP